MTVLWRRLLQCPGSRRLKRKDAVPGVLHAYHYPVFALSPPCVITLLRVLRSSRYQLCIPGPNTSMLMA
jgi:hypothetical protein